MPVHENTDCAIAEHQYDVFCSISAKLDGMHFSSEQLNVVERHLQEAVKLASQSVNHVRITAAYTNLNDPPRAFAASTIAWVRS